MFNIISKINYERTVARTSLTQISENEKAFDKAYKVAYINNEVVKK